MHVAVKILRGWYLSLLCHMAGLLFAHCNYVELVRGEFEVHGRPARLV